MKLLELIAKRRSVRRYKKDPVADKDLAYILEAARLAPSWANSQCWKFIVVTDPAAKKALCAAGNAWMEHAPVIITVCADPHKPGLKGDQPYYLLDVGIAMEHLILAATERGLGTCWVCSFDENTVRLALGVPADWRVVASTPLGFPAEEPPAKSRKPISEISCGDRFS